MAEKELTLEEAKTLIGNTIARLVGNKIVTDSYWMYSRQLCQFMHRQADRINELEEENAEYDITLYDTRTRVKELEKQVVDKPEVEELIEEISEKDSIIEEFEDEIEEYRSSKPGPLVLDDELRELMKTKLKLEIQVMSRDYSKRG